jgi:PAS domain S-box-containing protein
MKAVASKIVRKKRGDLKAIAASQITEPVIARKYQAIFKSNGKPMVIIDHDTTISLANAEFERLSGYTKKEIEGTKKWAEFVAQEDRKRMKEYHLLRKSDPMLAPRCFEFRFVNRYGKIKNTVLTIGQITGTNKSMASLQDVTDRRGAEITQRADEERYQTFFENSRDAVYITTGDGSYVDANRAALDLFGYTREEMKKLKARQLYADPADARRLRKEIEKKGFAQDFEVRLRKKDATEMDCLFTVTALRGDDGSILEYQGIARDVTERKRAVEALRESEEKYRAIFDSMLEGYFEVDLAGNFTFFNQPVSKFLGYPRDELMGLNYRKYTSPEEQQRLFQVFNEIYKTGNPHEIGAYEIIKKDGSIGIATFSVSLLRNAAGEPIGFRGVTRDMTEKKQTEARLQQSEETYRKILEMAPEGIAINRLKDERNVLVNDAFCRHTGYRREEIIGRSALELNLFCDRADHKRFAKTLRKEGRVEGLEINFWAKDGTILNDLVSARPIRFKGEDCLLVVATNINALKKAEEALRESEERYRSIIEDTEESYFETDLGGNYTFANDAECKMLGFTREELIGMNYRQLSDETAAQKIYNFFNETYKTGKPIKLMNQEITRKDGTKLIAEVSASLMRDSEGQLIGFRGIARDISKRTQAEETLRQSEEKYRTILENITEGYFENDLRGNFTFFNDSLPKTYGYSRDELLHMNYRRFMDEENAAKVYEAYNRIYTTVEPSSEIQFEVIRKDGTKRYLENSVSLIKDAQGKPIGFRGISRDITERKQMEAAMRQSEEKYRTILETMQEAYYEIDLAGKYIFVNDAFYEHLGYTKEELIGTKSRQYQDETTAREFHEAYSRLYRTGEPIRAIQGVWINKNGTKRTYELSASLMRDPEGKPIGFRGVSRDVTERKQMEEALCQSEEKYRTIIETMQDGYFEADLAGRYTFANEALRRRQGYSKDELIGMSNREFQNETNAKKAYRAFHEVYRTGEPIKALEMEVIKKDGTRGFSELSVSLIRDAQGKPIGFRGISHDITERKQMEEVLRQSEEKYRTILETMQEGYYELDLAGNFTFVNDAECKNLGYSREELIGMNNRNYQSEEEVKKSYQIFNGIYRTGEPVKGYTFEITKKDGTKAFHEVSVSLIRDEQGKPIRFRGVTRDVTERKQMEETLRQSEEQYRNIIETMQEGYFELDLKGSYTFANEALCKRQGYTKGELIGMNNRQFQDETNAQKAYQAFHEVYRTGEPNKTLEMETIGKDGTKRISEVSVSLIRDAQGKPIGFRGISHDITERKQIEEALRQNEERYRTIVETMYDGYFEVDLAGNFTFVNDAQCRMTGSSRERLIGKNNREYTTKEEAKQLYEAFSGVYKTGEPIKGYAFEFIKKDGTKAFNEISVFLIRDAQGKPIGFRGMSRDVTERKLAEEALRQSEEKYRNILENMQEGYTELDLKGNFTLVNDKVVRDLGYTKEELIGTNSRQYRDGKNEEKIYQAYNELYKTGETIRALAVVYVSKNGIERTYELTASLIRDEQGKPIGFRAVSRDITERKKAGEQLKRYAAELERSNEEVKNFAYIVSHDLRVPLVNLKGYTSELRTALEVIGSNFDAALPHLIDEKRSEVAMALHEDVPEALEFITNSVSRMDSFINSILILSRLGRQDLKPEPIDMNALVQTTVETMSHQIQERSIEVIVGSLPHVVADRTAMEQIIGNILSNAVKYVDPERPGRIEVAAEANNGETIFSIRDTGRGIAQEDMHKVFAPFRRAGKQDTQGEGMGLAYVQTLVHRHGGRIWCESSLGKGTTFTFTIATTFKQGASDV